MIPQTEQSEVTVTLPLPSSKLHPNGRCHWAVKAKLTKSHRQLARTEASFQTGGYEPMWQSVTVEYRAYFKVKRTRDQEGIISVNKAYMDGICDAKLIANDSGVTFLPVTIAIDRTNPRLEIVVRHQA